MYSQNNEEQIILEYFGNDVGRLLDIGANDGRTLSNSLALIERKWEAVLVEPDPTAFGNLCAQHYGNLLVTCVRVAIGTEAGEKDFYRSGTLLNTGDVALVSTLVPEETKRWEGRVEFQEIHVKVVDWQNFKENKGPFDFISIDAEGMDLAIVKQMDLKALGCRMLCIEWNGKDKHLYDEEILPQGYVLYAVNGENLIYVEMDKE